MKYSAPLDGIRAVAILGVLVFHALPGRLPGGFTGVDVFYVLSGFLITSNILHEVRGGTFTMREFYVRRVMRLLPNAATTILATVLLSSLLLLPSTAAQAGRHGLWALGNLSNFYVLRKLGGYWGLAATASPLLHTWSLAVEEQFYLVLPSLLWVLVRRPRLGAAMVVVPLASFALAVAWATSHPAGAFYLLPTRAWQPMIGAALAWYLVPASPERPVRRAPGGAVAGAVGWAGLGTIIAGLFLLRDGDGFPGWPALAPGLGAFAVLWAVAAGDRGPARWLSHPAMVLVGRLSYSIYLWHWPLITIGRGYAELNGVSPTVGGAVGAVAALAVSAAAYAGIERPLRARGPGRPRRIAVAGALIVATAAACLLVSGARPGGDGADLFDRPAFQGLRYSVLDAADARTVTGAPRLSDVDCSPADAHEDALWRRGGIVHLFGKPTPEVVVVGSSHALMYAHLVDGVCERLHRSVAFLCADGVSIFPDAFNSMAPAPGESLYAARARWVSTWRPDVVIGADRWDLYLADAARFEARVRALVAELAPGAGRVVLLAQPPVLRVGETVNLREYVGYQERKHRVLPTMLPDENEPVRARAREILERVAADTPALRVLRADRDFYRPDGSVRYADGRRFFYADDDHLSDAGADLLRDLVEGAIRDAPRR